MVSLVEQVVDEGADGVGCEHSPVHGGINRDIDRRDRRDGQILALPQHVPKPCFHDIAATRR